MVTEYVDGVYPLGALITRSVERVVYETEFGEGVPAMISIREEGSPLGNSDELAHPNLLKIYATGSSVLEGVPVSYVVMERAEESLDGVLGERALTVDETRDMLGPALAALDYLHKKGYAHSRLRPSNVMAVNDQLKLSTDTVIRANDGEAAEDMRALGVLIVQALTQKIPNADEHWGLQEFDRIPQPLGDIVRHCLDPDRARRWTAAQVKARLDPAPAVAVVKELPRLIEKETKRGHPKWIYAGLAAMLLVVILVAVMRNHQPPPVEAPVVVAPVATEVASPVEAGWSVIVGAYRSRELAEKRVREMTKRRPNFEISVFETRAEKTPYLVILGQNLTQDQAQALRNRAIRAGLPRDTYIKRVG